MLGWRQGTLSVAIACAFVISGGVGAMAQEQTPPCGGDEIARATVSHIGDGRTFTLADGREVRLAAIEVPPVPMAQESDRAAPPGGNAAKNALDALAGGDTDGCDVRKSRPTAMGGWSPMPTPNGTATSCLCRAT